MEVCRGISPNNNLWMGRGAFIVAAGACAIPFYPLAGTAVCVTGIVIIVATVAIAIFQKMHEQSERSAPNDARAKKPLGKSFGKAPRTLRVPLKEIHTAPQSSNPDSQPTVTSIIEATENPNSLGRKFFLDWEVLRGQQTTTPARDEKESEEIENSSPFDLLPDELLIMIFKYLTVFDKNKAKIVCLRFERILGDITFYNPKDGLGTLSIIPMEIIAHTFSFLSPIERMQMKRVSSYVCFMASPQPLDMRAAEIARLNIRVVRSALASVYNSTETCNLMIPITAYLDDFGQLKAYDGDNTPLNVLEDGKFIEKTEGQAWDERDALTAQLYSRTFYFHFFSNRDQFSRWVTTDADGAKYNKKTPPLFVTAVFEQMGVLANKIMDGLDIIAKEQGNEIRGIRFLATSLIGNPEKYPSGVALNKAKGVKHVNQYQPKRRAKLT
jgi:hypothetical protein